MRRTHEVLLTAIEAAAERAEADSRSAPTPAAEYAAQVGAATLRHLQDELQTTVERRSPLRARLRSWWHSSGERGEAVPPPLGGGASQSVAS